MQKMIKLTLTTAVAVLLMTGCGGGNTQTASESMSGGTELQLEGHTTNKKLHEAIMKAGEAQGLKMIEFKSNAIIAERANGDDSASATITFSKEKIIIMEETGDIDADDLMEAIEEELKGEEEH